MERETWDAVVVGAGPGGASTAYHLARAGLRAVLLERRTVPRDKSCGDAVTRSGVRLLDEMGVLDELGGAFRFHGIRAHMRGEGDRVIRYGSGSEGSDYGIVVPRHDLDHAICRRAVAAGAVLREQCTARQLVSENGCVRGVVAQGADGRAYRFDSRVVIAADGADSVLARKAKLKSRQGPGIGYAVRRYFRGISGLEDLIEFYMLLADPTDRYLLPSYGWVFPTSSDTANIGVGTFDCGLPVNVRSLFDAFLEKLQTEDPRFSRMVPSGSNLGALLRADFHPDHCSAPGLLLVGDAAGLISPFTGEGIQFALRSGQIAADTTEKWCRYHEHEPVDGSDYQMLLGDQYTGYFESGAWAVRRYRLIWQVLRRGFRSDRPIHRICRRQILAPEDLTESSMLPDVGALVPRGGLRVREGLIEVGKILTALVRENWPFLAQLHYSGVRPGVVPFRPSLLFLVSSEFGDPAKDGGPDLGAAVELGYLAFLAQSGVEEDDASNRSAANWSDQFCVLLADFLLAKAYELVGRTGVETTRRLAESVTSAASHHILRIRQAGNWRLPEETIRTLLESTAGNMGELPCSLGAFAAGANAETVDALGRFGRHLAVAHALVDEVLGFENVEDAGAYISQSDLHRGLTCVAVARALRCGGAEATELEMELQQADRDPARIASLIRSSGVLPSVTDAATDAAHQARAELDSLPPGLARRALTQLSHYVITRDPGESQTLDDLFDAE